MQQVREDTDNGGSAKGDSCGRKEKLSDLGCLLKAEPKGSADRLDLGNEKEDSDDSGGLA